MEVFGTILIAYLVFRILFPRLDEKVGGFGGIVVRILFAPLLILVRLGTLSIHGIKRLLITQYKSDVYGSADWLQGRERRELLSTKHNGLVINGIERISIENSYNHSLIVGPSGKGKSSTFFMVNAGCMVGQSFVCTDPKMEIGDLVIPYLSSIGYAIRWFNLSDPDQSHIFNPLDFASTFSEMKILANMLVEAKYAKAQGEQVFWNSGAENLIALDIYLVKQLPRELQHLGTVARHLDMLRTDAEETVHDLMFDYLDDEKFQMFKSWAGQEEKIRDGQLSTARVALSAFHDETLLKVTSGRDTLSIRSMRRRGIALFLTVPTSRLDYYGFILTILYKFLFDYCCQLTPGEKDKPIFFLLDEFANIPKVPGFDNIISFARSYRVSLSLGIQSLKQLYSLYGADAADTILENCASKIYFPGIQNYETLERISRTLGNSTITYNEAGFQENTRRDSERQRPLLTADEVRRLRDNQILYTYSNMKPLLLTTTRYYENKAFMRKMKSGQAQGMSRG